MATVTEEIFNNKRIAGYESRIEEINAFYFEYKRQLEEFRRKNEIKMTSDYSLFTTEELFHITPDFITAGGDLKNRTILQVRKYYTFSKYVDEIYPELSSLDLVSKVDKLLEMIKDGKTLPNGMVAQVFNLAVLSSRKYRGLYGKHIEPNLDKSLPFPKSFVAAIKKAKLIIKPENVEEMLFSIKEYKNKLSNNIQQEFSNLNGLKDDEFLTTLTKSLKKEYTDSLREAVVLRRKKEYYKRIKTFDKYMDYRFPELSFLNYDKKLEELLKKADSNNDKSSFSDEVLIDLLYLSAQVSEKYSDIYAQLSSSTTLSNMDAKFIMEMLESQGVKLDAKDMIEKLRDFDKFFTSGFEASNKNFEYISELQKIGFISREELSSDIDDILENLLPNAYGLMKLACNEKLKINPYDVQLMGAMVLNEGNITQMYTGEGKSITALFPAFLNAITGEEVDVLTPNDYLAMRDAENAKRILESLGISVGCVLADNQDAKEKKLAYRCNIVYGSSSAFAFDTISDSYEKTAEGMVQRTEKPRIAIIDEADQFFVDEALVPYKLDSNQQNEQENEEVMSYLLEAFNLAARLHENSFFEGPNPTDDTLRKFSGEDLMKKIGFRYGTDAQNREIDYVQSNYYIVLGETDAAITDLGNVTLFKWTNQQQINDLTERAKAYFLISPNYEEGIDYEVIEGQLQLTDVGLLKATKKIKEFANLESEWLNSERTQVLRGYIQTQLKAFCMKKGANDNGYDVRINPETGKKEIVLLQAGRVKEMSKYERGLHQALELKEGIDISPEERLVDSSFDSLTIVSLLNRYSKVCGMTGTADKEAFREIYHMETVDIPKNADYQYRKKQTAKKPSEIIEHQTVLYKENSYKINAIVQDILRSRTSGQPVLLITDSNDEAKLIFEQLQKLGVDSRINLLTSDRSLEEEARIISQAGRIGSITIASEMAGRGTDIKLFSKNDTKDVLIFAEDEMIKNNVVKMLFQQKYGNQKLDEYAKEVLLRSFKGNIIHTQEYEDAVNNFKDRLNTEPELRHGFTMQVRAMADFMYEIHANKGLKLIQSKPFKTSRHDRQARGRVGRQGEPGEVALYASLSDLSSIGVNDEVLKNISDGFFTKGKISVVSDVVDEEIERAQSDTEAIEDRIIAAQTGVGYAINSVSTKFMNTRKQLINTEDLTFSLYAMIEDSIDSVLKENVPKYKRKKLENNKKVSIKKLKLDTTIDSINDMFGTTISIKSASNCSTVGDLKILIAGIIDTKIHQNQEMYGVKRFNESVREQMLNGLNESYDAFMYYAEDIKYQEFNDNLAQNSSKNRIEDVNALYNGVVKDGWRNIMSNIFNPGKKGKENTPDTPSEAEELYDPDMVSIDSFYELDEPNDFENFGETEEKKTSKK